MLKTAARVLALAAVAVPRIGFPQPAFVPGANDDERGLIDLQTQIVEKVQRIQTQDGSDSVDLIEPLTALGQLYLEDGDHELAIAAFEKAGQVVRVNYGLTSLDEAPLIQYLVRAEEARGNVGAAWDLEQELLILVGRYPNDVRTVPILREIADRRTDVLRRYRAREYPPQIILGCYYRVREGDRCRSGSRTQAIRALAREAQWYRAAAIEALVRNELYHSDELRELEMEAVRAGAASSYSCPPMPLQALLEMELVGSCLEPAISREDEAIADLDTASLVRLRGMPLVNVGGFASLVRLVIYEVRSSAPALNQANALVRLADYQLVHGLGTDESTLGIYERAYRRLRENDVAQTSIEQIFSPNTPVVLPGSSPNPLAADGVPEFDDYIDVAFDITQYGRSEHIEILDTSTNATRAARKDLVRLLEGSRFRPRVIDGRFADTSPVVVRHYPND
jgi:tetratricopeptide (TPR) repeat protein